MYTTGTCVLVFTCITTFGFVPVDMCVICLSFPLSLTPSPPQLSLRLLHHFQSLLSLHLVGPMYITSCKCVVICVVYHRVH